MRSITLNFLAVVASLLVSMGPSWAQAPSGARSFAGTPILEPGKAGSVRVSLALDRRVEVLRRIAPGQVIFRLVGARPGGNLTPSISPARDRAVRRVALVPAGADLDLVIEVRRRVDVFQDYVATPEGQELRIDLVESPSGIVLPSVEPEPPEEPPRAPLPASVTGAPPVSEVEDAPVTGRRPEPPSPASPPPASPAPTGDRTLGGHTFLNPVGFATSFTGTQMGLTIGFSHADFEAIDASDRKPYSAAVAGLSQRLDLQVSILPRLAVFAGAGGRVAAGINAPTALKLGAEGGFVWRVGVAGVVARIERTGTQVGARLSVDGETGGRVVSLERLVDGAIESKQVPEAEDLFGARTAVAGRFSWTAAQAIGRHLSLQASIGWARTFVSRGPGGSDALHLTGGLAVTVDAAPYVPIAALFEYNGDGLLHEGNGWPEEISDLLSGDGANVLLAGLYYSGRSDLLVGALVGASMPTAGPVSTVPLGRLELRYFF